MKFFIEYCVHYSRLHLTMFGKNVVHEKPYLILELGSAWNFGQTSKKQFDHYSNLFLNGLELEHWSVKNKIYNPKTQKKVRQLSEDQLYAEKTFQLYSGSFAVQIDFINLQNQIMYHGLGELATQKTKYYDWIRMRRTSEKLKESAFFKRSEIIDFVINNRETLIKKQSLKLIIKPTFVTTVESDSQILEKFSEYQKNDELLKV